MLHVIIRKKKSTSYLIQSVRALHDNAEISDPAYVIVKLNRQE